MFYTIIEFNNYKIKISCTSKDDLSYNNKKIYNKLNLVQLINDTDYIEKILILYKKHNNKPIITKSLEFLCKCDNEISDIDFQTFIEKMINIGFSSNNNTPIHLIKINNNKPSEPIFIYNFQSITEKNISKIKYKPNNSTYLTHILHTK